MITKFKKEFILVIILLVIAGGFYLYNYLQTKNSTPLAEIEIFVNGAFYKKANIVNGETVEIKQDDGKLNKLKFTKDGVYMEHSSCSNQLCVHQGEVNFQNYKTRALGRSIICLPNNVLVSLVISDKSLTDANTF